MITEAEIQSIDFNSNSCIVRIPLFETAGTLEPFIAEAKICIQPGIFNGYAPKDIVWVDFINDRKEYPIVIGKIFTDQTVEKSGTGSMVVSPSIKASTYANIPNTTEINNAPANFNTVQKIINNIKDIQENIDDKNKVWDNYSTKEQQIGYWVDGKALYRKSYIITNLNNFVAGTEHVEYIDVNSLNYDTLWVDLNNSILITKQNNSTKYMLNQYFASETLGDYWNTYVDVSTNRLYYRIKLPGSNTAQKLIITAQYTKK